MEYELVKISEYDGEYDISGYYGEEGYIVLNESGQVIDIYTESDMETLMEEQVERRIKQYPDYLNVPLGE